MSSISTTAELPLTHTWVKGQLLDRIIRDWPVGTRPPTSPDQDLFAVRMIDAFVD